MHTESKRVGWDKECLPIGPIVVPFWDYLIGS